MPQISRRRVNPEISEKITKTFIIAIGKLRTEATIHSFFTHLLSPTEQIMLAKRLAIAYMLEKDYPHRIISDTLKVSTATVNRVNLVLKTDDFGYKPILRELLKEETLDAFFEKLDFNLAKNLPPKGINWSRYLKKHPPKKKPY